MIDDRVLVGPHPAGPDRMEHGAAHVADLRDEIRKRDAVAKKANIGLE
jgi:hypothetical protein